VEKKSTYLFDVTLSEAQVTDIALYIGVVDGGTATLDADFTIDNGGKRVYIPAGKTTGTVSITVLEDELLEETETFTIQIGDEKTANATIAPVTVDFTLQNLTGDDLVAGLSWETNIKDLIGIEKDADEVVDLRFLILDSDGAIVDVEDGSSFEHYTFVGADMADGVYTLAVDIYSTIDAGDFNEALTLDLALQFDQIGTINGDMFSFDGIMSNEFVCGSYRINLATVTKTGMDYTLEEAVMIPMIGYWSGTDSDYDSQVKIDCDMFISGLNYGWMVEVWGEEIIKQEDVVFTIDEGAGTVEILEQPYITTLYDGDEYPYTIKGTGTYSTTGDTHTMTINYQLFQDGWDVGGWAGANGYLSTPNFVATITL